MHHTEILNTALLLVILGLLQVGESYIYKRYYPDSEVERIVVPKDKKKWKVDFPTYDPPTYTAPCSGECDPDSPEGIVYDQKLKNSSRKSWVSKYDVDGDNYPRNPRGRTGMAGRGSLSRWGPNHAVMLIIKRGQTGDEVLVKKEELNETRPNFPIGSVDSVLECPFPPEIRSAFEAEMGKQHYKEVVEKALMKAKRHSKLKYRGYFPLDRNTDNAWTELAVYTVEDPHLKHIGKMKFDDPDSEYEWKQYSEGTVKRVLKAVVKMADMNTEEKLQRFMRRAVWSVKNRGVGGLASVLSDVIGNSLTLSGIVTTLISLSG